MGGGCRKVSRKPTASSRATPGVDTRLSASRITKLLRPACGQTSGCSRVAQRRFRLERNLALPDPFHDGLAPLPVRNQPAVLLGQRHGQVESCAAPEGSPPHPLPAASPRPPDRRGHIHPRPVGSPPHQQWRQLVHLVTWNADVLSVIPHVRHPPIISTETVELCSIFVAHYWPKRAKKFPIGHINNYYCSPARRRRLAFESGMGATRLRRCFVIMRLHG